MSRRKPRPDLISNYSVRVPVVRPPKPIPGGLFRVVQDDNPISLEGTRMTAAQILAGLKRGVLHPGMRFRHPQQRRVDFVLTTHGLDWPPRGHSARVARGQD